MKVKMISASSLEEMIEKMKEQMKAEENENRLNALLGRTFVNICKKEKTIPANVDELLLIVKEYMEEEAKIIRIQDEQDCDYDEAKMQVAKKPNKNKAHVDKNLN